VRNRGFQFGLSALMWFVVVAAVHCWLVSLGPYGVIIVIVADKHILVAYLCWAARVDHSVAASRPSAVRKAA
jgi:hypothetical protein